MNSPVLAHFPAPWKTYLKQKKILLGFFMVYVPIIIKFIKFSRIPFIATGEKATQLTLLGIL